MQKKLTDFIKSKKHPEFFKVIKGRVTSPVAIDDYWIRYCYYNTYRWKYHRRKAMVKFYSHKNRKYETRIIGGIWL